MTDIKLIEKDTNISELKMSKMPWDVEINGVPYQVVRIEGYVHSIGGRHGENNLWMYPRNGNYTRTKWDEIECVTSGGAMITRNGKDFYFCRGGIDEAKWLVKRLDEHPLELNEYGFAEKMIGKKVWWRSEPAIITSWIGNGQACVILEPDGIDNFTKPAEFVDDDCMDDGERDIKADIFDEHIWWFRE